MVIALVVFVIVTGLVLAVATGAGRFPSYLAARRLERRLREVSQREEMPTATNFVRETKQGPVPAFDRVMGGAGSSLSKLIEQSGVRTTPSAVIVACIGCAIVVGGITFMFLRHPLIWGAAGALASMLPIGILRFKRTARFKRFEEQFPEALDLLSRAIRAGHAFQTAMGMVADELKPPVGAEFKKTFDQQNFGLPLKDALNELAERMPIVDVKFFVTAVLIQRETGGNLAEILDNLAHVVRERFKILRQVRVHTAHGRFTGYVLMALPAALALALTAINPDHMRLLFNERMGQLMIGGAIVMQTVGYFWIRQVVKIEV